MRYWKKPRKILGAAAQAGCRQTLPLIGLFFAFALAACNPTPHTHGYGFQIDRVDGQIVADRLQLSAQLALQLSPAASEALERGIPITLEVTSRYRMADDLLRRPLARHTQRWELRYQSLSQHYLLHDLDSDRQTAYPRLRHLLAYLRPVHQQLPRPAEPGAYLAEVQVRLDIQRLPAPMRLPALLSPEWRLASDWTPWPFAVDA